MQTNYWTEGRIAGYLLAGSMLLLILAAVIMLVSGAVAGFQPMIRGDVQEAAPYLGIFQFLIQLFILGWVVQLLGIGLLCRLLARGGAPQLAVIAFILVLVTTLTALSHFSFRMIVEQWVGLQASQVGGMPALYQPLRDWSSSLFRLGYRLHFIAMMVAGWAILRTRLLAPAWGWAAIGWSALWLLGGLVGLGVPAVPLLMPAAIGLALMVGSGVVDDQRTDANSTKRQEASE